MYVLGSFCSRVEGSLWMARTSDSISLIYTSKFGQHETLEGIVFRKRPYLFHCGRHGGRLLAMTAVLLLCVVLY